MRLDSALKSAVAGAQAAPEIAKFRKAAKGVEQIFLKQLLAQLRHSSAAKDDSYGMGMYKDMMDDALATSVADRGDFGIAKQMQRKLEPMLLNQALAAIKLAQRAAVAAEAKKD